MKPGHKRLAMISAGEASPGIAVRIIIQVSGMAR